MGDLVNEYEKMVQELFPNLYKLNEIKELIDKFENDVKFHSRLEQNEKAINILNKIDIICC